MGYTTDFKGSFKLNKPLEDAHRLYLEAFSGTRRMKRNPRLLEVTDIMKAAGFKDVGPEGGYYVPNEIIDYGQANNEGVVDHNRPPSGQPSLWCQWIPATGPYDDAKEAPPYNRIVWDGGEKFYCYVEWLEYLIKHFLKPAGYVVSGRVTWQGEEFDDRGEIIVEDNKVTTNDLV